MVAIQKKYSSLFVAVLALGLWTLSFGLRASTIKDVRLEKKAGRYWLEIDADGRLDPKVETLGDRLVLKVKGGQWQGRSSLSVKKGPVERVRFGHHKEIGELHMVVDLRSKAVKRKVVPRSKGVSVDMGPVAARKSKVEKKRKARLDRFAPANVGLDFRIVDVIHEESAERSRIVISADGPVRYKQELRDEGQLLRLTFDKAALTWDGNSFNDAAIRSVRVNQRREAGRDQVRLDIAFTQKLEYAITRDQNQIIVTVDVPVTARVVPRKGNLNMRVDIDFHDADLAGVLKSLCRQAGFDYYFASEVTENIGTKGKVTFKAVNARLSDVFINILADLTMTYDKQGNVLMFGQTASILTKKKQMPQKVVFYSAKYIERDVLVKYMIDESRLDLLLPAKSVGADQDPDRENRLYLRGTAADVAKLRAMVARYDKPSGFQVNEAGADAASGAVGQRRSRVFKLRYIEGVEALAAIEQVLAKVAGAGSSGVTTAKVTDLPLRRSILVTGNMRDIRKVEALLERIDIKVPEVSIKAMIVELDTNEVENLGIIWNATSVNPLADPSVTANVSAAPAASLGSLTMGTVQNGLNISGTLSAMISHRKGKVLSSPTIRTTHGSPGIISSTESFVFVNTTLVTTNGIVTESTVFSEQKIPLTLQVTPFINEEDDDIRMDVNFTLTSVAGSPPVEGAPVPTNEQSATTIFRLKNGETGALGGLIRETVSNETAGIPILKDIPLLGFLFKRNSKLAQKREVIILLTPTIMD